MAAVAAGEVDKAWRPRVGQHVYIAGTGKWWAGHHFGAVVVDVRDSDSTVKVRYTDGGFKRFPAAEFTRLVTLQAPAPAMWEEWTASSVQDQQTELQRLHDQIMLAQSLKDADWEGNMCKRFEALAEKKDELDRLHVVLQDAVQNGDFLRAHEVQQQVRALEASAASERGGSAVTSNAAPGAGSVVGGSGHQDAVRQALVRSLGGGLAGAGAMVLQVTGLMWLRTTMNYQYRYGMSTSQAMATLYAEGGVLRFYRGYLAALLQSPMARFADTAANAGVMAMFDDTEARDWPVAVKTVFASLAAASVRVCLVPLDTIKTVLQVEGRAGLQVIASKYVIGGAPIFFHGAMATSAATFVGHYPWFATFNCLNEACPNYADQRKQLLRNAGIGFCASVCSDTVANSLRVVKTLRQTQVTSPYSAIVRNVVAEDGIVGLCGRGLKTRILTNGISGVMFSVLYKCFEEKIRL